jgi:hypothetical protein
MPSSLLQAMTNNKMVAENNRRAVAGAFIAGLDVVAQCRLGEPKNNKLKFNHS